ASRSASAWSARRRARYSRRPATHTTVNSSMSRLHMTSGSHQVSMPSVNREVLTDCTTASTAVTARAGLAQRLGECRATVNRASTTLATGWNSTNTTPTTRAWAATSRNTAHGRCRRHSRDTYAAYVAVTTT